MSACSRLRFVRLRLALWVHLGALMVVAGSLTLKALAARSAGRSASTAVLPGLSLAWAALCSAQSQPRHIVAAGHGHRDLCGGMRYA